MRGDAIKSRTSWEVDVDNAFYVNAADDDYNKQFINGFTEQDWADAWEEGDEFFSQYTSVQDDINRRYNTYAKGINKYDNTHMYVFILPEDKTREFGQVGDMPLGKQWGYLFVNEFGKEADKQKHYRTLSHELGHGRTALPHTFAGDKPEHRVPKGETTNLMDYSSGTDLVRAQWDMAHNPAIFTPLQSDGDGATVLFTETIENGELKGDNIMIGSHTFFTPAGYPITFPIEETLIIKKSSFESYILDKNDKEVKNIHVPSGALFKFNYDGANYFAHYKTKILEGTTEFVGYLKEGTVDTNYHEPSKLTENLALPFDVNYFNNGSLNTVKSDFCIKCSALCSSNLDNYQGDGPVASSISLLPLDYETYINSKFNQSTVLVNAIRSNPCVLLGMRSFGMIPPPSDWMNDFNNFVAVGLAAVFAVPVAELLLAPIIEGAVQYVGEEVMRDFITGAVIEAAMYYGVNYYMDIPINYDDFAIDMAIAGAKNIDLMPAKMQPLVACIQGIDMGEVRKVLAKQQSASQAFIFQRIAECVIPLLIETAIPQNSAKSKEFYQAISNSSTTKLVRLFRRLGLSSEIQLRLVIYQKNLSELLKSKSEDWVSTFKTLLPTDGGSVALDVLIDASFNITKLSKGNLEKLAEICRVIAGNDAAIAKLTNLFKGTKDFQRMIQHLYRTASTPEQYIKCMDDIGRQFDGTITIGSKQWNIPQFLDEFEYPGTMFEYYHTQTAGKHYLLKYESNTQQGFLLVIDDISKTVIDADSRVLVNFTKLQIEELFEATEGEQ
ncbi:MAG: hypothetical protein GXX78_16485 [Bacteroidales bacterium]|nr:hypothetical protein [Bacteroidales bacterium]